MTENIDPQPKPSPDDFLWEVFQRYAESVPFHPWFNERRRWLELVSCILFSFGKEGEQNARRLTDLLDELGFLDVKTLAELPVKQDSPDLTDHHLGVMKEIMLRMNYPEDDIPQILGTILSVARDVQSRYSGRVQSYLRRHGERMLSELPNDFPSTALPEERVRRAFTLWIQNVLTMPVAVDSPALGRFCKVAGCTKAELFQAADKLDISASIVDDLIDLWDAGQGA